MTLKFPISVLGVLTTLSIALTTVHAQSISNPLPDPVDEGGPGIRLLPWVRVPNSPVNGKAPRLNMLREVPDGSGFLWVNDQRGYLYRVSSNGGTPTLYLNHEALYPAFDFIESDAFQTGFSSFALHPQFAENGIFYTVISVPKGTVVPDFPVANPLRPTSHVDVLLRWTADDPAAASFSGSVEEVLTIEQPYADHNVGEIAFDPTARPGDANYALLYLAVADGGWVFNVSEPDPLRVAQSLQSPLGKILRIDPEGSNATNGRYGIPATNPFLATPDALPEIYSLGHRNPHRLSWDPITRMLYAFDIGTALIEEVNRIVPGGNYGWSEREGSFRHSNQLLYPLPEGDPALGYRYPVAQYDHPEPQNGAISGGFVYRGRKMPELYGQILFADFTARDQAFRVKVSETYGLGSTDSATVRRLPVYTAGGTLSMLSTIIRGNPGVRTDLRWGEDAEHELYLLNKHNGWIYQVLAGPESGPPAFIPRSQGWYFDPDNGWMWMDTRTWPWIWSDRLDEWVPIDGTAP